MEKVSVGPPSDHLFSKNDGDDDANVPILIGVYRQGACAAPKIGGGHFRPDFLGTPDILKKQTGSGAQPQKPAKFCNIEAILASKMAFLLSQFTSIFI